MIDIVAFICYNVTVRLEEYHERPSQIGLYRMWRRKLPLQQK